MEAAQFTQNGTSVSKDGLWTQKRQARLLGAFLALGVLTRFVRYVLCFPLWEDECFLCSNFIDRNYAELLQPLNYHQVAPLLFLWTEKALVQFFGFTEFTLRLLPFLTSIVSLFLFAHLARRLVRGPALVMAVAVFAVAYPCIRYAAEAKPYGSDLFVSLVMFTLAVEWWLRPQQLRWLIALSVYVPFAIGFSYPAVFSAGGLSLFVAFQLARHLFGKPAVDENQPAFRIKGAVLCWVVFNVALITSFAGFYFLTIRPQSSAELGWMAHYWQNAFPPMNRPGQLPLWFLLTHTSNLVAYPLGGENGASTLSALCIATALIYLAWRRQFSLLVLFLAPLMLHLTAAALQRYPYGVHVKYSQYIAPFLCLLIGIGIATWATGLMRGPARARWALYCWLTVLALVGGGSILRDIIHPYKTRNDMRARAFARWFWFNAGFDSETVCLKSDMNIDFSPGTFSQLSWSAMYICNQHIYSPRHHRRQNPDWQNVSTKKPLRLVQFKDPRQPFDQAAFQSWLSDFQGKYRLVNRETFSFPCYTKREDHLITVDYLDVYKFVPRKARIEKPASARK